LMFGVGLHFRLKDLVAVRNIAVAGALPQIALATGLGAVVAHAFGWTWQAGIVFGAALSVASTVVLVRVLADNRDLQSRTGRIAVGWTVVEDIFTVFAVVVLPSLLGGAGAASRGVLLSVGITALKLAVLVGLILFPGGRLIPRLLTAVARTSSRELFTLTVLVVALGLAVGSAKVFGVSMALGAFLAGMVVGKSDFSQRAASEALPMRDAFAVLFFVSIGMLFNPQQLVQEWALSSATVAIVLLGKPASALLVVLLLGHGARIGVRVAAALAQVGEFSFILALVGTRLGVLPAVAMDSLVAASIVTIAINPFLYRLARLMEGMIAGSRFRRILVPRTRGASGGGEAAAVPAVEPHAVIVGYGPIGASVARLLAEHDVAPVVIELNIDTVRRLQAEGMRVVYGDAAQTEILREAGVATAAALVLSAPESEESAELIKTARGMNPGIQVLARSSFLSRIGPLRSAGADQVFSSEAEVAMAMIEAILLRLGATPEEMDAERARARTELYRAGSLPPGQDFSP
ncbi:MAG TPA: cation:proton antiporter, partial [Bryobacteraceae bacterium]|nr:cation:proton antiporter [Bryobacteraceae bacterium]